MVTMGAVWDRATEFLSDNLSAVVPIALLAIFVPASIAQSLAPLSNGPGTAVMVLQLISLILSIIQFWGQVAIIALALDPMAGRSGAIELASRRLLPIIGIWLLLLLGVMVLASPMLVALTVTGFDFQAAMTNGTPALDPGAAAFVLFYFLAFVVGIIWLGARLSLIGPVILMERRGLGAFARSFKLTRSSVLKIIGILILYFIIWAVSALAAKLVFGAIFTLIAGGEGPVTVGTVLASICTSVVLTAFVVLAAAFTGKLYLAVRDAREAIVESA